MSKTPYILYRPYKDLTTIERLLMSWIISLNDAKQVVCFSNEYAGKILNQSTRNISRSIASLKEKGFINTFQPSGDRRFIHLLKLPDVEDISFQSCDLEGVENMSNHHRQNVYTPIDNMSIPIDKLTTPIDKLTTNNKEYNKEHNNDDDATTLLFQESWKKDERFVRLINQFPEDKRVSITETYDLCWIELPEEERVKAENITPHYLQRNINSQNYIKKILNYFQERFWNKDTISISLYEKNKTIKPTSNPKSRTEFEMSMVDRLMEKKKLEEQKNK